MSRGAREEGNDDDDVGYKRIAIMSVDQSPTMLIMGSRGREEWVGIVKALVQIIHNNKDARKKIQREGVDGRLIRKGMLRSKARLLDFHVGIVC